jgi:L-lactate dehydrogenase complex protein LldG
MSSHATSRHRILQRLRAAPTQEVVVPNLAAFYDQRPREDLATRVERLALNLKNAMAEVHRTTPASLATDLTKVIQDKSLSQIAVGGELLARQDLCDRIQTVCALRPVQSVHSEQRVLFEEADAGLTLSYASIAETGTIVLRSSPQSPRLLSLVPPVHIAIVDTQRLYDTLFDLMHQEGWSEGLPTNVILVSSPSKTADIQQTLAYGAHGPKQLVVMLVEDR